MNKVPGALAIIAYRLAERDVGTVFTVGELESWVLSAQGTLPCEHGYYPLDAKRTEVDRRLRELRAAGWKILSHYDDKNLASSQYRLAYVGEWVWHEGWSRSKGTASKIRLTLFKRARYRCADCGLRDGMKRDDGSTVRLTVGRILPGSLGGAYKLSNCRAECSLCNEPKRDRYPVEKKPSWAGGIPSRSFAEPDAEPADPVEPEPLQGLW